jgi:serine/threonine protein kinase
MPAKAQEDSGTVRLGKYELLAELASGGMATVFVARHVGVGGLERLVVIKRVHPHLLRLPSFSEMFRDEARVASLVRHPNVVPLLDVVDSDGELLIVLEYVESVSLAALMRHAQAHHHRLPVAVAARILADILAGLHAAHEAKDTRGRGLSVVHRDVSPQNVIVGVDGVSRLIDFGIAKAAARATETTGGTLKGKLAYMSPEQTRGASLDRRSDLFSAGIVLFEALTGQRLFHSDGSDNTHVLLDILLEPIPDPSSLAPEVPPALDAVVQKALERVREDRFQTAVEFQEALSAALTPASAGEVAAVVGRFSGVAITRQRDELRAVLEGLAPPRVHFGASGAVVPRLSDGDSAVASTVLAKSVETPSMRVVTETNPRLRRVRGVAFAALATFACFVAVTMVLASRRTEGSTGQTALTVDTAPPPSPPSGSAAPPEASAAAEADREAPVESGGLDAGSETAQSPSAARPVTKGRGGHPARGRPVAPVTPAPSSAPAAATAPAASSPPPLAPSSDLHNENPYVVH